MSEHFVLEVPPSTTTRFLIGTNEPVPKMVELRAGPAGPGGIAADARRLLRCGAVRVVRVAGPRTELRRRAAGLGAAGDDAARLAGADRHLLVTAVASPTRQPAQAQAARLVARTVALRTGGIVADLASDQVLTRRAAEPAEIERFTLGDEWTAVFVRPDGAALVWAETAGLRRFGLPELVAGGVPAAYVVAAVDLLRGLALRLVAEQWVWLATRRGARVRRSPCRRSLDSGDVLRYWGARPSRRGSVPLRLTAGRARLRSGGGPGPVLRVLPGGDAEAADWWTAAAAELRKGEKGVAVTGDDRHSMGSRNAHGAAFIAIRR